MDVRIRRFMSPRREKRGHGDLELQSVRYETSAPGSRLPIFIYQPLRKSRAEEQRVDVALCLKAFPYAAAVPGKAPMFGLKPHHGNGPVKLQTSRRLSSGDLLVTSQDHPTTLEALRGGEYIVGRKHRSGRDSACQQPSSPSPATASAGLQSREFSQRISSPSREIPRTNLLSCPPSPITVTHVNQGSNRISNSVVTTTSTGSYVNCTNGCVSEQSAQPAGLGISTQHFSDGRADIFAEQQPFYEMEPMTSLQALWRAEHSHLSAIYDQIGEESADQQTTCTPMAAGGADMYPHVSLKPLPPPPTQYVLEPHQRRSSSTSRVDPLIYEDSSDGSYRKRFSTLSSVAGSSLDTNRTSIMEQDPHVIREEVHKRIDEMRDNYLRAIEVRSSVLMSKQASQPKTTRKRRSTQSSRHSSGQRSFSTPTNSNRYSNTGAQSPVSPMMFQTTDLGRSVNCNPVAGISSINDVKLGFEESDDLFNQGLQRADSVTLGTMMGLLTIDGSREPKTRQGVT